MRTRRALPLPALAAFLWLVFDTLPAVSGESSVGAEGTIAEDSFRGYAHATDGAAAIGRWTHTTAQGHVLEGDVTALGWSQLRDRDPGALGTVADSTGPATWRGQGGYRFLARIVDRSASGGSHEYVLTVVDGGGSIVYLAAGSMTGIVQSQVVLPAGPPEPPPTTSCFVTGGGFIGMDTFGGNAMKQKDASVRGHWQHTTASGTVYEGDVVALVCFKDGGAGPGVPPASFNHVRIALGVSENGEGSFLAFIHLADRGEPGAADEYSFVVMNADLSVRYSAEGVLDGGNFQIHRPNPGHS